jgi:hypothetical protein
MADMNEHQKKAFDFASDLIKQIITLSVAVITLGIGGIDKLNEYDNQFLLKAIFIAFVLAIIFGIAALMNLTGQLDIDTIEAYNKKIDKKNAKITCPAKRKTHLIPETLSIYAGKIQFFSVLHVFFFITAIILTCSLALSILNNPKKSKDTKVILLQTINPKDTTLLKNSKVDTLYYKITK